MIGKHQMVLKKKQKLKIVQTENIGNGKTRKEKLFDVGINLGVKMEKNEENIGMMRVEIM